MAIREVLVRFTFEQQRQMINLIGTDVGDASLLLTPTNVVVTAINEVINGDVDLANQTIGMDDGTLASPSLFWDSGQGFYKVDANKLGLTTSLAITGDLEVDGDITFRAGSGTGGTLTFGDLNTDNIVFNADMQSSIIPDTTANYNLGSVSQQWNNLWIDGTASIDTLTVDENSQFIGYLQVDSGDIRVPNTQTTVDLFDDYATTVETFGDATYMRFGADDATGEFVIRSGLIKTSRPTLEVFNTVATTVNAFGAASNVVMGLSTFGTTGVNSNFNIRSDDTVLDGDLNVNGGELLSSSNTFDLLIANSDVRIGAAAGTGDTIINNTLKVKENLDLSNSGTNLLIKDNLVNSLVVKEGANDYVRFTTTDSDEKILIYKDVYIVGNLDISGTTTTIDTTNLLVEDKNIELGVTTAAATDAGADGGGITLKATTDKTIAYSNSTGMWESNIGWRVDHANNAGSDLLARFGNANNSGTNSAHLLLAQGYYVAPTDVDGTGAAAKILSDGNATFASVTSNGITQYALPTMTNGGQIGYDDATKSLRLYSNSSTSTNATVQLHFNQSGTAGIIFNQYQGGSLRFMGQTATAVTGGSTSESYLSHYEEGGWPVDFYGLSAAFTSYANKVGSFIRIGSLVHVHGFIQLTGQPSFTTASDYLRLGPLPFLASSAKNAGYNYSQGSVACQNFNFHDNDYSNQGQVSTGISNVSSQSYIIFQVSGNDNTRGIVRNSAIGADDIIEFSISYRV